MPPILMVWVSLFPKTTRFVSLPSNFRIPLAGRILKLSKSIPIPVDMSTGRQFLSNIQNELKMENIVHFYPEGILLKNYSGLRKFRRGAFYAAVKADKPVLPLAIRKLTRKDGKKRPFRHSTRYVLLIGEPVRPDDQLEQRQCIDDLRVRSYQAVEELLNKRLPKFERLYAEENLKK